MCGFINVHVHISNTGEEKIGMNDRCGRDLKAPSNWTNFNIPLMNINIALLNWDLGGMEAEQSGK